MARSSSRASSVGDGVRHDKLLSKILIRIVSELKTRGVEPTAEMMDAARRKVVSQWSSGMTDKDIRSIATDLAKGARQQRVVAQSAMTDAPISASRMTPPPAELDLPVLTPPVVAAAKPNAGIPTKANFSPAVSTATEQASELKTLMRNTTRRERENLANAEWISAMEKDRIDGIQGKKDDRTTVQKTRSKQRGTLDTQIDEHKIEAEAERKRQKQAQDDMTAHIENHRYLTRKEKQAAFDKEMKEKSFRASQQEMRDRDREEARTKEHNDQVRHCMMVREELEKDKQDALTKKAKERKAWEKVLCDNNDRLEWKAKQKEREVADDRAFQKNYADRLDRIEKERADTAARKGARAQYFQKMADGVAAQFMAKEQDLTDKIESEYNAQLDAAMKDEQHRKQKFKERTDDCQSTIKKQMLESVARKKAERVEAKIQADLLGVQIQEAKHQEQCRKMAAKQEAQRLKKYLGSQLQMTHFKEARPLETSIARPPSRSTSMYSPSKYTPSLRPESLVGDGGPE